jgi:GNAT superfamily N-acetyltransferase
MSKIVVKSAEGKDAKAFLSLIDALADYEKLDRPTKAARARLVKDAFGKSRKIFPFLAYADGLPAGYAIYFFSYSSFLARPTLFLEDLFVLPEYRKQKAGLALFSACLKEAKSNRCGRMEWFVLDWNQIAIDFYHRLGAKHLDQWLPYRLTSDQFDAVLKHRPSQKTKK